MPTTNAFGEGIDNRNNKTVQNSFIADLYHQIDKDHFIPFL